MNPPSPYQSEALIQTLFDQATEGMMIVDANGNLLECNAACSHQTGFNRDALCQFSLAQLFPEETPSPNIQFATYQMRQQNGRLTPITTETRNLGNGSFLLILHHPTEQKDAEHKIIQLSETIQNINSLAIKLNGLLTADEPYKEIARIISEIPGVFAVTVSKYQAETSELIVQELVTPSAEAGILKQVNTLIGRSLIGMRIPVDDHMHQRMRYEHITTAGSLHEITFGEIPKPISKLFHTTFRLEKLYGLALNDSNELLGTVVIAMRRNTEPLSQELQLMLGRICAITLRRARYENRLHASEAKFRSYVEHAPLAIFVVDENGRYLETNPAATHMLGYTPEQFHTMTISDILHPDYLDQGISHFQNVLNNGYTSGELRLRHKNGSTLWANVEATNLNHNRFMAFVQDISARKEAEANNQIKDELLHLTGEMAQVGGWEFDTTTLEGTWTDEVAHIHDLNPKDKTNVAIGLSFYDAEHRQKIEKAIENCIQNGEPYDLELPLVTAKGQNKWIRTMAIPIVQNDKIVKVRGIFQDITKSKKAEQALRQEVLLQEQLAQVAETVPGMICTFELAANGEITMPYASPALNDIYGLSRDALAQDATPIFENIHPEDLDYVNKSIQESAETMGPWRAEFRYNHPQKGMRWIEGHSRPQKQADGSIIWHGFIQDNTDRKTAEQEQMQLESQLRQVQKMDSIGRLAGGIAHDFNNLLTVIQMYTDIMERQMKAEDPLRPKLDQIKRASERAADLTRQLLAFSRKQILNSVVLDLNDLITHLQKMLGRLIGEDISISITLKPDLWPIKADPGQIEQVIMNLVVNARDAMPTGGMLTIETQNVFLDESFLTSSLKVPMGPCVMLAISDNGHGMNEATRQRIFEPFFTTKKPGSGTGLGLATVHGIVRQSGGSIFVYSEPNQGTTFKIYLPATRDIMPHSHAEAFEIKDNFGSETLLVVEDEDAVRGLVCTTLEERGYTVLAAKDGFAALSLMANRHQPVDLLLTDVVMPKMSGRELAEQLQETWPSLKVLFMSGYMDDAVVRHGILTAQVAFLPKPFSSNILANKVRETLDGWNTND